MMVVGDGDLDEGWERACLHDEQTTHFMHVLTQPLITGRPRVSGVYFFVGSFVWFCFCFGGVVVYGSTMAMSTTTTTFLVQ